MLKHITSSSDGKVCLTHYSHCGFHKLNTHYQWTMRWSSRPPRPVDQFDTPGRGSGFEVRWVRDLMGPGVWVGCPMGPGGWPRSRGPTGQQTSSSSSHGFLVAVTYLIFYSGFWKLGTNEFIECRFCCTFAVGNLMFDLILITFKCIELFKWKVERGVVGSIATLTIACILSIAVNGCTNDGIMRGWSNTMAWWHPNVVFTITVMVFCSICPQIANIDCLYPTLSQLSPQ